MATNPFDLLSSLEKPKEKAKGSKAPPQTNGEAATGLSASQKKRRAKAQKSKNATSALQEGQVDWDVTAGGVTSSGDKVTSPAKAGPDGCAKEGPQSSTVTAEDAAAFLADSSGKIDPALLVWADIDIKPKEEEFKVVSSNAKNRQNKAKAASVVPPAPTAASADQRGTAAAPNEQNSWAAPATQVPAQPMSSFQVEAGDAPQQVRELEESARQSWSWDLGARTRLWKQWMLQAQMPALPDGKLPWKQVFLSSQALEITLQGCLEPPLAQDFVPDLQALLGAFLATPEAAAAVAQVTLDLSQVIGSPPGVSGDPDLLRSARDALGSAVSCLKKNPSGWAVQNVALALQDEAVQGSLLALSSTALHIEAQLGQSGGGAEGNAQAAGDKTSCFKELAALGEKRLSTLLGSISRTQGTAESAGSAADSAGGQDTQVAALERVRGLTSLILQRKREGPAPPAAVKPQTASANPAKEAPGATSPHANGVGPGAAENEAALDKAVEEAHAHLVSCRKQLEEAERSVSRLRDACLQAESRHRELEQRLLAKGSGGAAPPNGTAGTAQTPQAPPVQDEPASAALSPAEQHQLQCARQLGTVHALETLLLRRPIAADIPADAAPSTPEEAAVWPAVAHAVTEHLRALASLLQSLHAQLQGAGQRLRFCREKIQKIKDEMGSYRAMGRSQMADSLARPLESAEGLHKVRLAELESVLKEADAVEAALHQPDLRTAVALLPLLPPVHLLLQQIGTTLHQIRKEHAKLVEPSGSAESEKEGQGAASLAAPKSRVVQPKKPSDPPAKGSGRGKGKKAVGEGRGGSATSSGASGLAPQASGLQGRQQGQREIVFEAPPKPVWQKPVGTVPEAPTE